MVVVISGGGDMAADGPPSAAGIGPQRATVGQHSDANRNPAAMWDLEPGGNPARGNPARGNHTAAPQHTTRRPGVFRAAVRRVVSGRLFLRAARQDGALPPPQLAHMPECVLTHICSFLRLQEVVHLGRCSRDLSEDVLGTDVIWSVLLARDFSVSPLKMLAVQVTQQARQVYKTRALRHRRHVQRNEAGAKRRARDQAMERRRVWLREDPSLCLLPRSVWPRLHDAELTIVRAILCVLAVVFVIVGTVYLRGRLPSLCTRVLSFVTMSIFYVSFSRLFGLHLSDLRGFEFWSQPRSFGAAVCAACAHAYVGSIVSPDVALPLPEIVLVLVGRGLLSCIAQAVYILEAACIVQLSWACVPPRASQTPVALYAIGLFAAGAVLGNECYSYPRELVMWGNRGVLAASWHHEFKLYSTARTTRDAITPVLVQMAIWATVESAGPYFLGVSPLIYFPQFIYKLPVLGAAALVLAAGQVACFVKSVRKCCVGVGRATSLARGSRSTWVNLASALTLAAFWMLCALALENLLFITGLDGWLVRLTAGALQRDNLLATCPPGVQQFKFNLDMHDLREP